MSRSDMSGPLIVNEGALSHDNEAFTDDGEISITSGIVTIGANLCITAIALTLPDPVANTDDSKRLHIVDIAGAAHTVTPDTTFGNGGSGEAKATFSGVIGDSIALIAYQGAWYVTGKHQVTIGTV